MKKIILVFLILTGCVFAEWEFNDNFSHPAEQIRKVTIYCPVGMIECLPSNNDTIEVDIKKVIYYYDKDKAEELSERCTVDFKVRDNDIIIEIELPGRFEKHGSFFKKIFSGHKEKDIEIFSRIFLPSNIDFDVETASADISASDLKNKISVNGASADVFLDNISDNVAINLSSGDLEAEKVTGDIKFSGASSDIQIEDLTGDLIMSTSSGDCFAEAVRGDVRVETASGGIRIFDLDGNLEFSSTSGDLKGDNITGTIDAESTSGNIKLRQLKKDDGEFDVNTISGDVYLELAQDFGGNISIRTVSGNIDTRMDLNFTDLSRSYFRGTIGSGDGRIHITTVSGDIILEKN